MKKDKRHILSTSGQWSKSVSIGTIHLFHLLFAIQISVSQMRKWIKFSVCLSGRVLPLKRLFIHPWSNIYSKIDNSSCEKYFPKLRLARGLDAAHTGCTSRRRFDAKWEITEIWIIFQKIFPQNHRNLNNLSLNILKITKLWLIFQKMIPRNQRNLVNLRLWLLPMLKWTS